MITMIDKQGIKGYKTAWIKYEESNIEKHQFFFKEHSIRNQEPEYPRGQTLFLLNVPPYATPEALKRVFTEACGAVKSVTFTSPKGFKTAYIVFEKESGLEEALTLPADFVLILNSQDNDCLVSLAKWRMEYNNTIIDEKALKEEIEQYMSTYDQKIAEELEEEKKAEEEGDDGWVTVTGKKKRGKFALARKESTIQKVQHKENIRTKKKELLNFYTFQIREAKKQNLAELRKKFELDKQRLVELKKKRTFKPF